MQIRNENDKDSKDYVLQNNKKTRFGITFILIIIVILIAAVAISGVLLNYW